MAAYTQGTFFNISLTDEENYNQWDEVKALNENAKASPVLGFSFNMETVRDEIASCVEIWQRYRSELPHKLFFTIKNEKKIVIKLLIFCNKVI